MVTFTFKSLPGLVSLNGAKYRLIFYFSKWVSRGYPEITYGTIQLPRDLPRRLSVAPLQVWVGRTCSCDWAAWWWFFVSISSMHTQPRDVPCRARCPWSSRGSLGAVGRGALDLGQALVSAWKIDILYNLNVVKCIDSSYLIISSVTVMYL